MDYTLSLLSRFHEWRAKFGDYSLSLLSYFQEWRVEFGLANPWRDPFWFIEDIKDIVLLILEGYCFNSPVFWACWYVFLAYVAKRIVWAIIRTIVYLRRDYLGYLSLGRGRSPSNVRGWLANKWYQFLLLDIFGLDVFSTPRIDPYQEPYNGTLFGIPERQGPRPQIIGIGPMRQADGGCPPAMAFIMQGFRNWGLEYPESFRFCISERTHLPMFKVNLPDRKKSETFNSMAEWGGEIAHVRYDGSMSIHLHPSDAAEVIRRGWGQRNPLAVMNEVWIWRVFYHRVLRTSTPLPSTSVIVYAPSDSHEGIVVARIMTAAVRWANSQTGQ